MRLAPADLLAVDETQFLDAIRAAILHERIQREGFGGRGRYNYFSGVPVWHAMSRAELVCELVAPHAMACLQRSRGVVDSRVDDTAVAGTGSHSKLWQRLKQEDITPGGRQCPGDGASDDTAANQLRYLPYP